jgi:competence protein ComEC
MGARPAWLALGVIVAAGTASYQPFSGDSIVAIIAAAAVSVALAVAACLCRARGRRSPGEALVVASLGASLVAARLSIGLVMGSGAGPIETTALPDGSGPWNAIVESAHTTKGLQIATIDLADRPLHCSAQFPAYPRLIAGDFVRWSGRVRPLRDDDYDRYLAAQGISATCEATDLTLVSHDDSVGGRLEAIRQASGDALQKVIPEPEGGLATAILIGLRDRVDRSLAAAFTTAGVSHIVAISGWNIAIVAATVAALLRGFVGRRRRAFVTIGAIVAYTLFAGATPSVNRAALMSGVALMAIESGRGSRVMVSLAWAISIMLLMDPGTADDVGFQLSAAATAGLITWATPLSRRIGERFPRLPGGLRDSLGVSLTAQAATLPIALLTFGRLSLIAPAANLVAVPLVPPAMAAGAIAFVAGWLAVAGAPVWLTGLLAMPAQLLFVALVAVVQLAASVPGASETLSFPANVVAATVAALLLVRMHRALPGPDAREARQRKRSVGTGKPPGGARGSSLRARQRWALAGAVFVIAAAGSVVAARPDGSIHVIVLDVGQGDSILLEGDRGSRVLVDGGPDPNVLMTALDRYVPSWDRRLDAIILTHPHDDHVAGLVAVVERYRVGRAFESGWPATTSTYEAWKAALSANGLRAERLSAGQTLRLDDAMLEVLWPEDGTTRPSGLDPNAADNRKANDASIVLLGAYEGRRFLLTGDVEDDVDPILLGRGLPAVDMLKVAHHGSATASSDDLLAAVHPSVAVVSVGANNRYGHPNAGTMARIRAHSQTALRTDQAGTVETTLDRTAVTVTAGNGAAGNGAAGNGAAGNGAAGNGASQVGAVRPSGLLYDSPDVRSQPSQQRGPSPLTRASCLAPSPRAGSCRDGGLASTAGGFGWTVARSPPSGGGRTTA